MLDETARQEWDRVAPDLSRMGLLTTVDKAVFAAYCDAFGRWTAANRKIQESSLILKTAGGNLIQNPYVAIANRAIDQMVKISAEFGMTPSSRSRIHVEEAEQMSLADMLFGEVANEA